VLFCSLVDDPSVYMEDEVQAGKERRRLFGLLERLVAWESAADRATLNEARLEIARSLARNTGMPLPEKCTEADIKRFLDEHAPIILDPFCGGGIIPLEAQRFGLRVEASDLNPVAVMITKGLTEMPQRFSGRSPVNPIARDTLKTGRWQHVEGLSKDVEFYGLEVLKDVEKRIGNLYPDVTIQVGRESNKAKVIAWMWARVVRCPNPACGFEMPLARSFILSTRGEQTVYISPILDKTNKTVKYDIRTGPQPALTGTVERKGAKCLACGSDVPLEYVRTEGKSARIRTRLMAIAAEGPRGRHYLPASVEQERLALAVSVRDAPDTAIPEKALGFRVQLYGMNLHADLFTRRQLAALMAFSDSITAIHRRIEEDAMKAGMSADGVAFEKGGKGATAYADAVVAYLSFVFDKVADINNSLCRWKIGAECPVGLFSRQAIPMVWDFAEANPLSGASGSWESMLRILLRTMNERCMPSAGRLTRVRQLDATACRYDHDSYLVCTDPPYYDNIGYADLSDFFYVWLRRTLGTRYPDLFSTMLTPKKSELVATPFRFDGDMALANEFFENGFHKAFSSLGEGQNDDFPMTVFYAFKQSEIEDGSASELEQAALSTGWETMLQGLLKAGFQVCGTWPMRTEMKARQVAMGTNALASSIVLVCRKRSTTAPPATRREFVSELRRDLPGALRRLQQGSIAPVDFAQATIGPGMAVFSRYSKVLEADGTQMTVRTALQTINQELEAYLRKEEGEMDVDTQFCVAWFEQLGMAEGSYGQAEVLTKAKNTSMDGLVRAGVVRSKGGKVQIVPRQEYSTDWNPLQDARLTLWECTQHLVRSYQDGGEASASELIARLGYGRSEEAKTLAYRLFSIAERKGWAEEARVYNELITAWPEIQKKAAGITGEGPQKSLDVGLERRKKQ
jgi:putative DNA methylase